MGVINHIWLDLRTMSCDGTKPSTVNMANNLLMIMIYRKTFYCYSPNKMILNGILISASFYTH